VQQEQQEQHHQPATEALSSLQLHEDSGPAGRMSPRAAQMLPTPSDVASTAAGAAPTITIVSGNQLRVHPATWGGGGGGGGQHGGGSPAVNAGPYVGDGEGGDISGAVPRNLPPPSPSPFQGSGPGFGQGTGEGLLRRPSYGTQVLHRQQYHVLDGSYAS
jgi:hypothetical protein